MTFSQAALKEIETLKKENAEAKKNSYFGKVPLDLHNAVHDISSRDMSVASKMVKELNEISPVWFSCRLEAVGNKGDKFNVITSFSHEKLGDMIINRSKILRIPKLLEGGLYEGKKGAWRYFGKNELTTFTEKTALEELQAWGFYQQKYISEVSRYTKQKAYDPTYSNTSPFEESAPELVVFKNGTYNILTDEMKPHDYKDYILTSFNYDLDTSGRETTHTDKFFEEFFGENALFMKQYIGYLFYRSYSPAPDMVFLYGQGGEGKSSFLNMVTNFYLGIENVSALTPEQIGERFSVVDLLGRCANICGDIDSDYISTTAILKRVTGGDNIKGEFKGIQGFNFISYAKLFFSMNEFFHFKDMSTGFSSRLTVVPIVIGDQRLPENNFWDNHDTDLIKEEAPAFVYSCMREFRKIFNGKKVLFAKSKSMESTKNEWLFDNDRIAQFLFEATETLKGDERGEIASTVYSEYKAFCRFNGFVPKSAKELTKQLSKKGVVKNKSSRGFNDGGTRLDRYISLKLTATYLEKA